MLARVGQRCLRPNLSWNKCRRPRRVESNVVGWSMSAFMTARLVCDALRMALFARKMRAASSAYRPRQPASLARAPRLARRTRPCREPEHQRQQLRQHSDGKLETQPQGRGNPRQPTDQERQPEHTSRSTSRSTTIEPDSTSLWTASAQSSSSWPKSLSWVSEA